MALNPLREALGRSGLTAYHLETPFKAEADAALAGFETLRSDLERRVRRGDLTTKNAREQARQAAQSLRDALLMKARAFSPVPRPFLDRLVEVSERRKQARERQTLDSLQRETNRLLRQTLIEQQLITRAEEFAAKTFTRSMTGGPPAPTLDSLLDFHEQMTRAGDEAAREWARRQLDAMRPQVFDEEDQRRIDLACDRPDQINPRIVGRYVESLRERDALGLEEFVAQAIESRDASACAAAFLLAREAPEGSAVRWVRLVLENVKEFPDRALDTLRTWEAEARRADAEAALASAEYCIALADAEADFPHLEAPSRADLERQARFEARPVAQPDQPIGLNLQRRGLFPDEFPMLDATASDESSVEIA